jgi:hypothetical protein
MAAIIRDKHEFRGTCDCFWRYSENAGTMLSHCGKMTTKQYNTTDLFLETGNRRRGLPMSPECFSEHLLLALQHLTPPQPLQAHRARFEGRPTDPEFLWNDVNMDLT